MNSQYNLLPYSALQYNLTEAIELTISHVLTSTDGTVVKDFMSPKVDSIVSVDALTKEITEKLLVDSVRTNDWFSNTKSPQTNSWSD